MATTGSTSAVVSALRAAGCVFAEEEAAVLMAAADSPQRLAGMVPRRVAGTPLEVVVGWAEFCGLRIEVDPGVFVPRRRTELVVAQAVAALSAGDLLVDLCCGTGAIGVAVAAAVPGLRWYAAELEPAAVACARRNVEPAGGVVCPGDLFEAMPQQLRGRVDVVTANAPYVPTGQLALMPPEARDHEPLITLDGGADGLDVQRRVIAWAPRWLRPGGVLLVETGRRQAAVTASLMAGAGLRPRLVTDEELAGTVVIGQRPSRNPASSSTA